MARALKDNTDSGDEERLRNLRAIHLSCNDPHKKEELISEINRILVGMTISQKKDSQATMESEQEKELEEMKSLQKLKITKTFDKNFIGSQSLRNNANKDDEGDELDG